MKPNLAPAAPLSGERSSPTYVVEAQGTAMTARITELSDRGVLAVLGPDAESFLQGLVTANVEGLRAGTASFAALLTPQGKILFDFFALRTDGGFLIDVSRRLAADLAKRLGFYKLRAKVEIADLSETHCVLAVWGGTPPRLPGHVFADPRLPALGHRIVLLAADRTAALATTGATAVEEADWHAHRIALGVPEGGLDFAYGDAFPHDADMDDLAGVDFGKGCYVGQEVVSRMKHRGTARRRVVMAEGTGPLPATGTEIMAGGKPIGTLGSTAGPRGLALVRIDRAREAMDGGLAMSAGAVALTLTIPPWARFAWPETVAAG